jgi:osmotically-inducible protein OsmY
MRNRAVTFALVLLPATAGVGCAGTPVLGPTAPTASTPLPPLAVATSDPSRGRAVERVTDPQLVRVSVRQLNGDPLVARERIRILARDGVVMLEGAVTSALVRRHAVAALEVVRGVRAIVDRIVVASPEPPPDDELLALAAASALARDGAFSSQEHVSAHVRRGVVRLAGTVESDVGRRIAEEDVGSLPGVRNVIDDLAVDPLSARRPRSESVLAHQVEWVLGGDPWVDRTDVRVWAHEGTVHLRGTVRSGAERARAESDARATSPGGVDVSELRIVDGPDDGTLRANPPSERPDADLRRALADACGADPRVRPFVPEIDVRNGVVVLTGVAQDQRAADAAAEDAGDVPGVMSVRNAMQTSVTPAASDAELSGAILDAIRRDPTLGRTSLWVEAVSGRVILRGVVPNDTARIDALALASSVAGVVDVEDAIIVEPPKLTRAQSPVVRGPLAPLGASANR